jgi:ketosteroid isomerase-like protein
MNMFYSASDAESAFYTAFEKADIESMMDIWLDSDDILCIHPGAPRVDGVEDVKDSWQQLFQDAPILSFSLIDVNVISTEELVVSQVREEIEIDGQYVSMMLSTNVFQRDSSSLRWHLTSRHSSPEPDDYDIDQILDAEEEELYGDEKVVLH